MKTALGVTHFIFDRDTKFTPLFKSFLEAAGVKIVLTPTRSPKCNAIAERFSGTLRREILKRMIFFGEERPRRSPTAFVIHYHGE